MQEGAQQHQLVSLTLARVGCAGGRRLSRPPAVVLRLPWASIIPVALGAATSGAQSTQWVAGAAGWRASRALTHTRRAAASPDRGDARAGEVPEGVRGAPSGGRPAAVTPHAALSRSEGDSRQPPCGDVVSSRAPPAAAAETYVPCGQPARCTCRSDPPRPAHSASTPRGPPRYSGGPRGYPASGGASRGRDRATGRRSRGRSKSFLRVGAARLQPGCAHLSALNTRAGAAADATGHAVTQAAAGPNTRVAYRAHACGRLRWTGRHGAATATPSVTHVSRPQPLRPL